MCLVESRKTDYLGSTWYISTRNGSISQHVEYIAFGEVLFEEHASSFSSPYLFNGKELDRETNLSYYGARYLDMKTSLWLSLDKEGENDLSVGVYVYSFNNPINFTDPDGNWPDLPSWGNSLVNRVKSAAKSYVAHKIDNLVANSRNYVNQKINSVKASISKTISKIENYEGGGYMLSNGSGVSSGDQSLIRKGGRTDVEMVDASGLVQAGSFASSKRDGIKYNGSVKMTLKLVKETVKGVRIGDKVAGKFDANNDSGMSSTSADESSMIDMKLEDNNATGTIGWTESVVNTKTRDTTVNKSQKGIIDKMNKLNRMRAEQKAKTDNAELQKKINYYKE